MLVLLLLLLSLVGAVLSVGQASSPRLSLGAGEQTDANLYRSIIADMHAGESYYPAAARELRQGHYPLKPFVTFRLPTLSWLHARLGPGAMRCAQWLLALALILAWAVPVRIRLAPVTLIAVLLLIGAGIVGMVQPTVGLFPESWSAMLLSLAVVLDRPGQRGWAMLSGLAALLLRELALPMVLCFAGLALFERRWRAAAGWGAVVALFAIALGLHAIAVARVVRSDDLVSLGWNGLLGPGYALRSLAIATPATLLPTVVAALLFTLSLFGWCSLRSAWALRAGLMTAGYIALLALFARTDTFYWGLMAAPLSLGGLAFVRMALADLAAALRGVAVTVP